MDIHFYDVQLGALADASKRSRWVLIVGIIAAIADIAATYNFGAGWLRHYTEDLAFAAPHAFNSNPVVKELQLQLIRNWVDQLFVNVPVLGIRFSNSDATVLGGLALMIIALWFFYCTKRENQLVAFILQTASREKDMLKAHVFHAVSSTQVFGTILRSDEPIRSLDALPGGNRIFGIGVATKCLFFLPFIAVLFSFVTDLLSIFLWKALFRGSDQSLYEYFLTHSSIDEMIRVIGPELLLESAVAVIVFVLLLRAYQFHSASVSLLTLAESQNFGRTVPGPDPDAQAAPAGSAAAAKLAEPA